MVLAIAWGAFAFRTKYLWIPWNPAYTSKALNGLSRDKVVSKIGQPHFDPIVSTPDHDWKEDRDGEYYLAYYGQFGATCTVRFQNGIVSEVRHTAK